MSLKDSLVTVVFVGVAMGFYDALIKNLYLDFINAQGGVVGWGQASIGYIISGAIGVAVAHLVMRRRKKRQVMEFG